MEEQKEGDKTEEANKKEEKQNLMKNAFALINNFGASITRKKIDTAKGVTIFIMIAGLVVFSLLWKVKFLMILTFVVGLIFLIAEFALESFFLGGETMAKKDEKSKDNKPKPKEEDKGWLSSLGIPGASDYSKQAEEGMFGPTGVEPTKEKSKSKPSKKGKKDSDSNDIYDVGLSSINPVRYEDVFGKA